MKCSHCRINKAIYFCSCNSEYICYEDLSIHMRLSVNHPLQTLLNPFSEYEKESLQEEIVHRIKLIKEIIKNIQSQVKSYIVEILDLEKKTIKELNRDINFYLRLLDNNSLYTENEVQKVKNILDTYIEPNRVSGISEFQNCRQYFSQKFSIVKENDEKIYRWRKEQFLKHHNGNFTCGAVSMEFSLLVSGSKDCSVRLWDLKKKCQISLLGQHMGEVKCVIITDNPELAITGSFDKTLIVWNIKKQIKEFTLLGHTGAVFALSKTNNPLIIVSGGYMLEILLWNLKNRTLISSIPGVSGACFCIKYSNRFEKYYCGVFKDIQVWEFDGPKMIDSMSQHSDLIYCLAFTSDEALIVSSSNDSKICIWNAENYSLISTLEGHTHDVQTLLVTPDNQFVISGSGDSTVKIWGLQSKTLISSLEDHTSRVNTVLLYEGQVISLSSDAIIIFWDLKTKKKINSMHEIMFFIDSIVFASNSLLCYYGSTNKAVAWDLIKQKEEFVLSGCSGNVRCMAISEKLNFALAGLQNSENNLLYWTLKKNAKPTVLKGHESAVFSVSISSNSCLGISGSSDRTVRLWDLKKFKEIHVFRGHSDTIYSVVFTQDCKFAVSGGYDKKVFVWNIETKEAYACFEDHTSNVWKIVISSDDQFAISCTILEGVKVWDIRRRALVHDFKCRKEGSDWFKFRIKEKDVVQNYLY